MDRSGEVEALVLACHEAWGAGDVAAFEPLLANDETVLLIETGPKEWWSGRNAVIEALRALLPEVADMEFVPGHPPGVRVQRRGLVRGPRRMDASRRDRGAFPNDGGRNTGGRRMEDATNTLVDRRRQRGRDRSRASGLAASLQGQWQYVGRGSPDARFSGTRPARGGGVGLGGQVGWNADPGQHRFSRAGPQPPRPRPHRRLPRAGRPRITRRSLKGSPRRRAGLSRPAHGTAILRG